MRGYQPPGPDAALSSSSYSVSSDDRNDMDLDGFSGGFERMLAYVKIYHFTDYSLQWGCTQKNKIIQLTREGSMEVISVTALDEGIGIMKVGDTSYLIHRRRILFDDEPGTSHQGAWLETSTSDRPGRALGGPGRACSWETQARGTARARPAEI